MNSTRAGAFSQCSCRRSGVMWSYRDAENTSRAAAFITDWNRLNWYCGRYTVIWATNQLGVSTGRQTNRATAIWGSGRQILDDWATRVGSSGRQDINFLNATFAESNAVNVRQTTAVDTANRSSSTFCVTNYAAISNSSARIGHYRQQLKL